MIRVLKGTVMCDTHDECVIIKRILSQLEVNSQLWDLDEDESEIDWTFYEKQRHRGDEDFLFWFIYMPRRAWTLLVRCLEEDCKYMQRYSGGTEFGFINDSN